MHADALKEYKDKDANMRFTAYLFEEQWKHFEPEQVEIRVTGIFADQLKKMLSDFLSIKQVRVIDENFNLID